MDQTINKPQDPNTGANLPLAGQYETIIDLTDVAANEAKRLIEAQDLKGQHLRVGVQGGGCSGLQYSLHFDEKVNGDDQVFEIKGVKVVIKDYDVDRDDWDGPRIRKDDHQRGA